MLSGAPILLLIVALWAAYLVPMFLSRYDRATETRSVDRFSTAMRSLAATVTAPAPGRSSCPRAAWRWPPHAPLRVPTCGPRTAGPGTVVDQAGVTSTARRCVPDLAVPARRAGARLPGAASWCCAAGG